MKKRFRVIEGDKVTPEADDGAEEANIDRLLAELDEQKAAAERCRPPVCDAFEQC